jgi:hypothetical protein
LVLLLCLRKGGDWRGKSLCRLWACHGSRRSRKSTTPSLLTFSISTRHFHRQQLLLLEHQPCSASCLDLLACTTLFQCIALTRALDRSRYQLYCTTPEPTSPCLFQPTKPPSRDQTSLYLWLRILTEPPFWLRLVSARNGIRSLGHSYGVIPLS